jgi:hypothetical protein
MVRKSSAMEVACDYEFGGQELLSLRAGRRYENGVIGRPCSIPSTYRSTCSL